MVARGVRRTIALFLSFVSKSLAHFYTDNIFNWKIVFITVVARAHNVVRRIKIEEGSRRVEWEVGQRKIHNGKQATSSIIFFLSFGFYV